MLSGETGTGVGTEADTTKNGVTNQPSTQTANQPSDEIIKNTAEYYQQDGVLNAQFIPLVIGLLALGTVSYLNAPGTNDKPKSGMTPVAEAFWTVYGGGVGKKGIEVGVENAAKTTAKESTEALGEKVVKETVKKETKEAVEEVVGENAVKTAAKESTEALGEKVAKESAKDGTESVAKTAEKKAVEDSTKTAAKKSADNVGENTAKTAVKIADDVADMAKTAGKTDGVASGGSGRGSGSVGSVSTTSTNTAVKVADEASGGSSRSGGVVTNAGAIRVGVANIDDATGGALRLGATNLDDAARVGSANSFGASTNLASDFEVALKSKAKTFDEAFGGSSVAGSTGNAVINNANLAVKFADDGVSGYSMGLYTPVEYTGSVKVGGEIRDVSRRVYQRSDIDINYFDTTTGMTNLERMYAGKPPIGSDGNPIQLHHILQKEAGPMVEIEEIMHQKYYLQLHGLIEDGASFRNNPVLNKQYNNFRRYYWKWRAGQIIGD